MTLEPYYSRSWTDTWTALSGGIVATPKPRWAISRPCPCLYRSLPFAELVSAGTGLTSRRRPRRRAIAFGGRVYSRGGHRSVPRIRIEMVRLRSALDARFLLRALARAGRGPSHGYRSVVGYGEIRLGQPVRLDGGLPARTPFRERRISLDAPGQAPGTQRGGGPSLDIQFHGLATLHAGESDELDSDSKVSVSETPGDTTGPPP